MTTKEDSKTIMLSPNPDRRMELWDSEGNIIQVIQYVSHDIGLGGALFAIAVRHLEMAPGNCVNICAA